MDFSKEKLVLDEKEATDLMDIFRITGLMVDWGIDSGVVKEPTEEQKRLAYQLKATIRDSYDKKEQTVTLLAEHFPSIREIAEIALANSQKVISGLCTPNIADQYKSDLRPDAYRALALTAEISELIHTRHCA